VILSAAALPFTLALLGERWRPMAAPLAVLGIWGVMRPLQVTLGTLLNSLDRAQIYGRVATISLVPLVVATFGAARLGGITAVAWVLLLHMAATFAILAVAAARIAAVPLRALAGTLWPFAIASVAAWVVTRVVAMQTDGLPPGLALVAAAVACLATYLASLALLDPGVLEDALHDGRRALGRAHTLPRLRRKRSAVPALGLAAAALEGAVAGVDPKMALALIGAAVLLALPFVAPVAHLLLLLGITAIVPFELQNAVAFGGGPGSPGLVPSDLLLGAGLARAGLVLLDTPLPRRARWALGLVIAVLGVATIQAVHGLRAGYDPGTAGTELRVLLGFGAAVIAIPVLADPTTRARLFKGLIGVGLAIGVWGIVQWTVDIPMTAAGDAGVREGVRLTTAGRGQIQGGLFAFPVVVVMGVAALLSHEIRSGAARALLIATVALNAVDLVLTYERTFWVATLLALVFLALHMAPRQRLRALTLGPALVAVVVAGLAIASPGDATAARERLVSITQYGSDLSVRFRVTETRNVVRAIEAHPVGGSGLGATILWGRAYEGVRPTTESFAHNGYLWLVWKLGAPGAVLLVALLATAVLSRSPPATTTTFGALRAGASAALLVLLVASITFPAFNALGITAVMGVLVAICAVPLAVGEVR
jgi:hypothetical protein